MKCCEISAGDLRNRVKLERLQSLPDGSGGFERAWLPETYLWAMLKPLSGRERMEAERLDNPVRFRAIIRYREDITPADRIVYKERAYNIRALYDTEMKGRWLELELTQGDAT